MVCDETQHLTILMRIEQLHSKDWTFFNIQAFRAVCDQPNELARIVNLMFAEAV